MILYFYFESKNHIYWNKCILLQNKKIMFTKFINIYININMYIYKFNINYFCSVTEHIYFNKYVIFILKI